MTTGNLLNTQIEVKIWIKCLSKHYVWWIKVLQQYCPLQSSIISNTVYCSSTFCGVNFSRAVQPSNPGDTSGIVKLFPPFSLMSTSSCSGCQFWFLIILNGGYEATPLQVVRIPLLVGWSILCQGGRQVLSFLLTWGYLPLSPSPLFGLVNHDPVWWVVIFILRFTIHQHQQALMSFPLPHIHVPSEVHSHITLPKVFTHLYWMLQWMSMTEVVTSH